MSGARRLAFSTLGQAGLDTGALVALASTAEIAAVELRVADGEAISPRTTAAQARVVGRELADAGVEILALCGYVGLASTEPDQVVVDELRRLLEVAGAAGAGGVRVFVKSPDGPGTRATDTAAARLQAALQGAPDGVQVLIETHDSHPCASHLRPILDEVPEALRPAVGVIWDTAHTWIAGEPAAESAAVLKDSLRYVQIKDIDTAGVPVELGAGTYPVAELAGALDSIAYQGALSLEWEHTWHQELRPLPEALVDLRHWAAPLLRDHERYTP